MKIWVQSGSGLTADSSTPGYAYGARYEQSLEAHFRKIARPDTTLDVHGIDISPPGKDRYYASQHLVLSLMIKSIMRADDEGYDVIAISNTIDPGVREIREITRLPVVFITESALHVACMLAPKFGFLAHNGEMLARSVEMAARYGLAGRMAVGVSLDLAYDDFVKMYEQPEPYIKRITDGGQRVIGGGATILLCVGNALNMFLVDHRQKDIAGIPMLDVCGTMIKVAELRVDLRRSGIDDGSMQSTARPNAGELAMIKKLYGMK